MKEVICTIHALGDGKRWIAWIEDCCSVRDTPEEAAVAVIDLYKEYIAEEAEVQ